MLNTDAEGRLVLADVLNVAVTMGADRIVDMATLTGFAEGAAAGGTTAGGLLTNNDGWGFVLKAAERSGEFVWQLPMFLEYNDDVKSEVADGLQRRGGRGGPGRSPGPCLLEHLSTTCRVTISTSPVRRFSNRASRGATAARPATSSAR